MFSARVAWDTPHNQLTQALRALRQSASSPDLIDLAESNPTRVALLPEEELRDLLAPLADPRGLCYAPDPRGLRAARVAVADYYQGRGIGVDPDHLVLCASTSEAYAWLFQLLCDPGDQVLIPQPSYPLFGHLAGLCAVKASPYPLRYDGRWRLHPSDLEEALADPTARALLHVSPNNPTGSYLHRGEQRVLDAGCARRGVALIADEVFGDYPLRPEPEADAPAEEAIVPSLCAVEGEALCFVLSGLSKVLGLPQLKLGWIHTGGPLRARAQDRLELIADTFLSVGAPVQLAAAALLKEGARLRAAIHARVRHNHEHLRAAVQGSACQLLHVEGGWYGVLRVPRVLCEEEWALRLLREDHVLCHPGYFFDFPAEAYLIVSLLPAPERFRTGVARLLRRVEEETAGDFCATGLHQAPVVLS